LAYRLTAAIKRVLTAAMNRTTVPGNTVVRFASTIVWATLSRCRCPCDPPDQTRRSAFYPIAW
jgi:hypothetical protein